MANDKLVVGIDLGTTFSSIAYVNDQGRPEAIPNADGKLTTPSAVLIEDGRISVGNVAVNQWTTNEEHVIRWIKREMGEGGRERNFLGLSAVEISAEILKALKADAEAFLKRPVTEAVITCPAYFAALEIENTREAGIMAGFHVREIVKEPTAAAVYYGIDEMRSGQTILVCDLGGGTFDATVLTFEKGVFTPRASMGDRKLGGHDWTMDLLRFVSDRLTDQFGRDLLDDPVIGQTLYEACEKAKRDLARLDQVVIPCSYEEQTAQVVVTRQEFEAKTEWRIDALVMWSEAAVEKAGLTWNDIHHILLVGGSSRLRRMAPSLEARSGHKAVQSREPDLMVALGAAILAHGKVRPKGGLVDLPPGALMEVEYQRIITRSLGTRAIVPHSNPIRVATSLLIPHSTEAPVSRSREDFEISRNGQDVFDIPIVEFEDEDTMDVVGNYQFTCLPIAQRGDRIKITFYYDQSGILTVDAVDLKTNQPLKGERLPYQEPGLRLRPRWVVFAVDTSSSMTGEKMTKAKEALLQNTQQLLDLWGDQCRIGIVSFASYAATVCEPTSDIFEIRQAVAHLYPMGTTSMDEGIERAVEMVMAAPAGADRDVVMLTDGMPDDNRRQQTLLIAGNVNSRGITLSCLGIGSVDVDMAFLQSLTPLARIIDALTEMSDALGSLLTLSADQRGGLIDVSSGGLSEV